MQCEDKDFRCLDFVVEPANKMTMMGFSALIEMIHNNHIDYYRSGFSSVLMLEETFDTIFKVLYLRGFDPFYESFNKLMSDLAAGGFLTYWESLIINPRGLKMRVDEIGPQVLTTEHLMFGFQIYLGALAISSIAFCIEITIKFLRKKPENFLKSKTQTVRFIKVEAMKPGSLNNSRQAPNKS